MFYSKFPEGLRVLVFDEDPEYLLTLEKYLQEFQYEVTTCSDEQKAMYLLRNHRNRFNIAIIEVHDSEGDRFRLISEIGLEMDLPVIIMSKDDSIKSVINWMRNGACDYLIKPIRAKDLQFIFKHVVKKIQGRSVVTGEKTSSVGDSTIRSPNERKLSICLDTQVNEEEHYDHYHDRACVSTSKKRRVVWDVELHKKFIDAVEYLGIDKAVPKKILEIMNVENISRENVASHLHVTKTFKTKFRINQKKRNDEIGREEKNLSFMPQQEGIMYVGEDATEIYHINNIPQPYVQQFSTNPNNHTTQHISRIGHHHDRVSFAVSDRDVVLTHQHQHQHQHHHQISDFPTDESLAYIHFNEDEDGHTNSWPMANSEDISLSYHESPMVTNGHHHLSDHFKVKNVHETKPSPMMRLPSFPYSYTHNSSFDQLESGVCNYDGGYSVNNSKLN